MTKNKKAPNPGEHRMMHPKSLYHLKKTGRKPISGKREHVYVGKTPVSVEHKHGKEKHKYRDDTKTEEEDLWVPVKTFKNWLKSATKVK